MDVAKLAPPIFQLDSHLFVSVLDLKARVIVMMCYLRSGRCR